MDVIAENLGRNLLFIVSFIGLFAFLGSMMPVELSTTFQMRNQTTSEYFEAIDIQSFVDSVNITMDESPPFIFRNYPNRYMQKDFDLGGHDVDIWYKMANSTNQWVELYHFWNELIIIRHKDVMHWTNKDGIDRGTELSREELNADYTNETIEYTVDDGRKRRLQFTVYFAFNTTLYSTPEDAWNYNNLQVMGGIGIDQINTTQNAWGLISLLLWFDSPDLHPLINFMVHLPIWTSMAYLVYRLILMAIPFVGGSS